MRDFVINNSLNIIKKSNPNYDDEKLEILEYGLTGLYIFVTKSIVIFSVAYFLGILIELFIFMLIYNSIRLFSFGMHATSSIGCLIASTISFLSATYFCKLINIPFVIKLLFGIIGLFLIIIYSPADTEKKPIISSKWRCFYKIMSSIISIIMIICSLRISDRFISNSCIIALLIQCFMISPFAYKITKQKYNNYKNYQ